MTASLPVIAGAEMCADIKQIKTSKMIAEGDPSL